MRTAELGADVVIIDIDSAEDTVTRIEAEGGSATYRHGDVTDEGAMERAFEDLTIDVLVNNAAYYAPLVGEKKRFDQIDLEEWETVQSVNTTGVFIASKAALPRMDRPATVVNISSGVVIRGEPGFLHYVASKAAVLGMTRSMARELAPLDIRVNAVLPGFTASEASLQLGQDYLEEKSRQQPLERMIQPEDIADAVAFLASDRSRMITGQVLNVDGGRTHY